MLFEQQKVERENAQQLASYPQPLDCNSNIEALNANTGTSSQPTKDAEWSAILVHSDVEMDAASTASGTATASGEETNPIMDTFQPACSTDADVDDPKTSEASDQEMPKVMDEPKPKPKYVVDESQPEREKPMITDESHPKGTDGSSKPKGTIGAKRKGRAGKSKANDEEEVVVVWFADLPEEKKEALQGKTHEPCTNDESTDIASSEG